MASTPDQLVNALHQAFGQHHARAVHAKGIILEGEFTPDERSAELTRAVHLQRTKSKVVVRFSDFTGIPNIADNVGEANPRGFSIQFQLPGGATTDIVAHSFNGFPVQNPDQFRELLLAVASSGPGARKPTSLDRFLESHPVARRFLTTQKTPASYATIAYFGVNAFQFTNQAGVSRHVRYQFIPAAGEQLLTQDQLAKSAPDYLLKDIETRVTKQPVRFTLQAQVAEDGDPIEDPSKAWPDSRKLVPLGQIEIQKVAANTSAQDKALFFIPSNVPDGIRTADPMLDFRSQAYPISVQERQ